jgi:hypothetical protein
LVADWPALWCYCAKGFLLIFLLFIIVNIIAFAVVFSLVEAIVKAMPRSKNVVAFALSCGGTYALGFSAEMVFSSISGSLPLAGAIAPIFTWLMVAIFCQFLAVSHSTMRWPLFIPYFVNAGLAFFGGLVATQAAHGPSDFAVATTLLIVGCLLIAVGPKTFRNSAQTEIS